ncbi:MAG: FAD-dependent oxidoreductase, partial [Hyphomonas sp.]|nr:FAD-dependent oxidoreductase [Hyphomonas sp.]
MAYFSSRPRIAVIGAGIIGLSAAYELAVKRGARVTIYDVRPPGRGASWAAAGMLAPAFEAAAEPGVHPRLFDLCLASGALWPEFASELAARSGLDVGLDSTPSLAVAL